MSPDTVECAWRAISPLVENSYFRGYRPQSCSKPTAVQIHDFPKEHNPLENPSTALLIAGLGPQTSKKAFLGTEPDAVERHPSELMRTQHLQTGGQAAASHSLCPGGCHREKWAVGVVKPAGGAEQTYSLAGPKPDTSLDRSVVRGSRSGKRWLVKEEVGFLLTVRRGETGSSEPTSALTFQHTVAQSIAWNPTSQNSGLWRSEEKRDIKRLALSASSH